MSIPISGGKYTSSSVSASVRKDHRYKYPGGLKLHPTKQLHKDIIDKVNIRALSAKQEQTSRHEAWDRTDDTLQAYIDLSVSEQALKDADPNRPVKIVVPYTYAALETMLTYMTTAFLQQTPMLQYDSVSVEDTIGAKLLEVLVQRQMDYYKTELALYTWWRDALAYGIGACVPVWRNETQWSFVEKSVAVETLDGGATTETQRVREPRTIFSGTELFSVGPRNLLIDPNVSCHETQNGEFFGFVEDTNVYRLLSLERENPDVWFNAKYVLDAGHQNSQFSNIDQLGQMTNVDSKPVTLLHFFVNLLPQEWGVPADEGNDGYYPEKWLFTLADDWCVVRAERLESSHGKFPVAIAAPDFDGYSTYPIARMDIIEGLQTVLNWLFNSHIANVRKTINNTFVYDPMVVEMDDIKTAREGGLIRMRASAWGMKPQDALYQLPVTDVTRNHINDAGAIIDMMQRVSAASDNMMGMMRNQGERVSATEARTVAMSAMNRMEKMARLLSVQGLRDLALFYGTNIQDYMDEEIKLKVLGNWPQELINEYQPGSDVIVDPSQLNIPFDVVMRDGSLPMDTGGVAESWIMLFSYIAGNEVLSQKFDTVRVFKHIARLLGAKNVNDFEARQVVGGVMPDETVEQQVQAGNFVNPEEL